MKKFKNIPKSDIMIGEYIGSEIYKKLKFKFHTHDNIGYLLISGIFNKEYVVMNTRPSDNNNEMNLFCLSENGNPYCFKFDENNNKKYHLNIIIGTMLDPWQFYEEGFFQLV